MFNTREKAETFKDDAETRFGALIEALSKEERLIRNLREAFNSSREKEATDPGWLAALVQAVEEARRNSGEALERWREIVRTDQNATT